MDIHPPWHHAGKQESTPIPIHGELHRVPIAMHRVSRRPAAIAGIVVATMLGLSLTNGWDALREFSPASLSELLGQIVPASGTADTPPLSFDIKLTDTGADPIALIVNAGGVITFINGSSKPQIVEFEGGVSGATGLPLVSDVIFPGTRLSIIIPETTVPALYGFHSSTDAAVHGQILVQAPGATLSPSAAGKASASSITSSEPLHAAFGDLNFDNPAIDDVLLPYPTGDRTYGTFDTPRGNIPATTPTVQQNYTVPVIIGNTQVPPTTTPAPAPSGPVVLNAGFDSDQATTSAPATDLPRNPYVYGSATEHPFDANGKPIASLFNDDGTLKVGTDAAARPALQYPSANATTGAHAWIVFAGTLGLLFSLHQYWRRKKRIL